MSSKCLTNLITAKLDLADALIRALPQPLRTRAEALGTEILGAAQAAMSEFAKKHPASEESGPDIRKVPVE